MQYTSYFSLVMLLSSCGLYASQSNEGYAMRTTPSPSHKTARTESAMSTTESEIFYDSCGNLCDAYGNILEPAKQEEEMLCDDELKKEFGINDNRGKSSTVKKPLPRSYSGQRQHAKNGDTNKRSIKAERDSKFADFNS